MARWLLLGLLCCGPTTPSPDPGRPVTGDAVYLSAPDIPRQWQHLFRDEVSGPYYLAFSWQLGCKISSEQYTMLRRGQTLSCDWKPPRGI